MHKTVLIIAFLTLLLLSACTDKDSTNPPPSKETLPTKISTESAEQEEEAVQSVTDRILEIKDLYAKLQAYSTEEVNCKTASKTTYDGLSEEHKYPFENTAEDCQLKDNFSYKLVELNGYEWGESTTFYYKDNQLFFTFLRGGAEACAYEYRVYYAKDASVIRILLTENDCNAEDPPPSTEVKDEQKKEQILKAVRNAEQELISMLQP